MQVTVDPDERFLHQVLRPIPVPDRPVYEIEQPGLVAPHQLREREAIALQKTRHQLVIRKFGQRNLALRLGSLRS